MKLYELAYGCRLYDSFTDIDISLKFPWSGGSE
jgi:hypothetical protein